MSLNTIHNLTFENAKQESKDGSEIVQKKRQYSHISREKKLQLIQIVVQQKCRIKKVAKDLKINYATAKTILHNYRKKKNITLDNLKRAKRAAYCSVKSTSQYCLITTLNNNLIKKKVYSCILK